jgi:hypothetical protein
MFRCQLLSSLVKRGVLREYAADDLNDSVFRAAAAMPLDKDELSEALTLLHLLQSPEDVRSTTIQSLRSEGYDPENPRIDSKFLCFVLALH